MQMIRTLVAAMIVAALMIAVGCNGGPDVGGNGGGDNTSSNASGGNGGGGGAPDMGEMMLNSAKGTPEGYAFVLPPGVAVGNWWEMTTNAGGTETKQKYMVVAEKEGKLVVENEMDYGGTMIIFARLVDPSVDLTQQVAEGEALPSNVSAAWCGLEGKKPVERTVTEAPKMPKVEGGGEQPADYEEGEETISLGGKDWEAKWMSTGGNKTWMAKGTNFMLKMEGSGMSMMLSGWGDGAESKLDWSE